MSFTDSAMMAANSCKTLLYRVPGPTNPLENLCYHAFSGDQHYWYINEKINSQEENQYRKH